LIAVFFPDGRILADSTFKTEDDALRIALGWPTKGEVRHAMQRGLRVERVEIIVPPKCPLKP
jgi:hypothetical protein